LSGVFSAGCSAEPAESVSPVADVERVKPLRTQPGRPVIGQPACEVPLDQRVGRSTRPVIARPAPSGGQATTPSIGTWRARTPFWADACRGQVLAEPIAGSALQPTGPLRSDMCGPRAVPTPTESVDPAHPLPAVAAAADHAQRFRAVRRPASASRPHPYVPIGADAERIARGFVCARCAWPRTAHQ
jgi:hypothetical protein